MSLLTKKVYQSVINILEHITEHPWSEKTLFVLFVLLSVLAVFPAALHMIPHSDIASLLGNADGSYTIFPELWSSYNFGQNNASLWLAIPINTGYYFLLKILHLSPHIAQFMMFASMVLLGLSGMYYLLRSQLFGLGQMAAFVGALFYVFNPYTITYLPGSFYSMIPHFFLPLQFLLYTLAIYKKSAVYAILAAFVMSLSFGMNLVFDVIAFCLLFTYGLWSVFALKLLPLRRFIWISGIFLATTLLLVSWWFIPYILTSMGDISSSNSLLASETFYNNDSSPLNLLRFLGSWGFFGSNAGIPYFWFSPSYKTSPLMLLAPFLLMSLIFAAILTLFSHHNRLLRLQFRYFVIAFIILLAIVGGKHDAWPTSGLAEWSFENVPFFSIFRNTHKWMSLVIFCSAVIVARIVTRRSTEGILSAKTRAVVLVTLIAISAYPMATGRLFNTDQYVGSIPTYWYAMAEKVRAEKNDDSRTLLLPDQYFDAYRWNDIKVSIPGSLAKTLTGRAIVANTCIGCAPPRALEFLKYIYPAMNSPKAISLLKAVGVTSILQRNDYDYVYYNKESPAQVAVQLHQLGLATSSSIGALDFYSLRKGLGVAPRVMVPNRMLQVSSLNEAAIFLQSHNTASTAFILEKDLSGFDSKKLKLNAVATLFTPDDATWVKGETISTVQIPRSALYELSESEDSSKVLEIMRRGQDTILNVDLRHSAPTLKIDDITAGAAGYSWLKTVSSSSNESEDSSIIVSGAGTPTRELKSKTITPGEFITFYAASSSLQISNLSMVKQTNLLPNGDFSDGLWQKQVSNCEGGDTDKMSMSLVAGGIWGNALSLTSTGGLACTLSLPVEDFDNTEGYEVALRYKIERGAAPSFCVWDGTQCLVKMLLNGAYGQWHTYEGSFTPNESSSQLVIFLYTPNGNFIESESHFSDISVKKALVVKSDIDFSSLKKKNAIFSIEEGMRTFSVKSEVEGNNLIDNSLIHSATWNKPVSNCSGSYDETQQLLSVIDTDNQKALELKAHSGSACTSIGLTDPFYPKNDYLLSFDSLVLSGNGRYCIWDGMKCLIKSPPQTKAVTRDWQHSDILFTTDSARQLRLFIYADSEKDIVGQVVFQNLSVKKLIKPVLNSVIVKPVTYSDYKPVTTTYVEKSLTLRVGEVTIPNDVNFPLVFLETYHPGWRLYVNNQEVKTHFVVDSFANGWVVNTREVGVMPGQVVEYRIEYSPQRWFYVGLMISAMTILLCLGYLGYHGIKRVKSRKY